MRAVSQGGAEDLIVLDGVSKSFRSRGGDIVPAVEGISFGVPRGAVVCILGPTGCGKSTILRLVAGLEAPDSGRVDLRSSAPEPGRPAVGHLTQGMTLLPWLTVEGNVALPLKLRSERGTDVRSRCLPIMEALGLGDFASLYPYELSGGMQQRTAMGRLLASDAGCWLLDEPFASLDERTRHRLQDLIIEINRERAITILFVTHSIDEAVYIADRVHVLSTGPGRIVESLVLDDPRPRSRLSGSFGKRMEEIRRKLETVLSEEAVEASRQGKADAAGGGSEEP